MHTPDLVPSLPAATASPSHPSADRRRFVASGAAAFAGLAFAPAFLRGDPAVPAPAGSAPSTTAPQAILFGCPLNADGTYALPPLPYAYEALEPSIDAQTMHLHHDLHFAAYMKGLNAALAKLTDLRSTGEYPQIAYWENQLAFNGSGYFLHNVFFQNLAPAGSNKPTTDLQFALAKDFGTFDAFQSQFTAAATTVEGSGWAILGWQPFGQKAVILQAEKHQNLTQWGVVPILALDVWEHAYYLKYQNKRADYIKAWWNVVNWDNVAARFEAARQLGNA
jgi:Fe-Mn family superoxide dismutase